MREMFFGATYFNQPIGGWDVRQVATMGGMFSRAVDFNHPIGEWDVPGRRLVQPTDWRMGREQGDSDA
jgi:hypothetical protein